MIKIILSMSKINKKILLWYLFSGNIIGLEIYINLHLNNDIYFHPYISFLIRILLIFDIILFLMILSIMSILKDDEKPIMKAFLIVVSNIGIVLMGIVIVIFISLYDRAIFNIDTQDIRNYSNKIVVHEKSTYYDKVYVYKKENFLFVKYVDCY